MLKDLDLVSAENSPHVIRNLFQIDSLYQFFIIIILPRQLAFNPGNLKPISFQRKKVLMASNVFDPQIGPGFELDVLFRKSCWRLINQKIRSFLLIQAVSGEKIHGSCYSSHD